MGSSALKSYYDESARRNWVHYMDVGSKLNDWVQTKLRRGILKCVIAGLDDSDCIVLDVGCGHGQLIAEAVRVKSSVRSVVLNDLSREMLERAGEAVRSVRPDIRVNALEGAILSDDVILPSVDTALLIGVLNHFEPRECLQVLRKICAAPCGKLICSFFHDGFIRKTAAGRVFRRRGIRYEPLSVSVVAAYARDAGFSSVWVRYGFGLPAVSPLAVLTMAR